MNSNQLDGKGPRLLVTHSPELVSGTVWPMALHQEMTPADHLARILYGRHVALGSVHTVYSKVSRHNNTLSDRFQADLFSRVNRHLLYVLLSIHIPLELRISTGAYLYS